MIIHPDAKLVDAATGETMDMSVVDSLAEELAVLPTGLLLVPMPTTSTAILNYLAALRAGRAVALIDPAWPLADLAEAFRPAAILGDVSPPAGYDATGVRRRGDGVAPHPDLAVLLATGEPTGGRRLVRLSRTAITTNAAATAHVLNIGKDDVAVTNLPPHHGYGMSVLHSHLLRGATVVVTDASLPTTRFWQTVADHGVTTLTALPQHFRMLRRLRFDPADHPTLRTVNHAGAPEAVDLVDEFHRAMTAVGGRTFVLYGQAEAAPHMAILPPDRLPEKPGTVGPALPGGQFTIGPIGDITYHGPNVMLGYATCEADLARGDDCHGELATGDVGHLDSDGYLTITGRTPGVYVSDLDDLDDLPVLTGDHEALTPPC